MGLGTMASHTIAIIVSVVVLVLGVIGAGIGVAIRYFKKTSTSSSDPPKADPKSSTRRVRFAPTKRVRRFITSTREWKGDEYTQKL